MKDMIKVGVVIADEKEYKPVLDLGKTGNFKARTLYGDTLTIIPLYQNGKTIDIYFVLCGIGKVNAAAAAAYLVTQGVACIINSGLSGGIKGIDRCDITLGDKFVEHDFDLTPLGFEPAQKPQDRYIYQADARLNKLFLNVCPHAKVGTMVCGDRFVSSETDKNWLVQQFSAMSCDMESAAVASVCNKAGIPFAALRRISDDAGQDAPERYREMNDRAEATLVSLIMQGIGQMCEKNDFFE